MTYSPRPYCLQTPKKANLELLAAESLWQQQRYVPAINLLTNIDPKHLDTRAFTVFTLLYGRWAVDQQQLVLAESLLESPRIAQLLDQSDINMTKALHSLRAEFFDSSNKTPNAIQERIMLSSLLMDPEPFAENNTQIWSLLRQLSPSQVQQLNQSGNKQLRGWLALSEIADAQDLDLEEQIDLLDQWLQQWSNHPAAKTLPTEMKLLRASLQQRPTHITLLLPMSGPLAKAGETLTQGFFAAYYQALQQAKPTPTVQVVDSHQGDDFLQLYQQVAASGTDLIIGPLDKQKVQLLSQQGALPIPTLCLNYSEASSALETINLYQFGLNPEDEAKQAATLALQNRFSAALVIAPDNSWGKRVATAFDKTWQQDDATTLGHALFNAKKEDYSQVIQKSLGITDSKLRLKKIRQLLDEPAEFEPRRRKDLDVIFLAAKPEQARQIKPLLAFHYAGQVPVYAISSIYSGEENPEKDTDLNGVYFNAMPWLLQNSPLKNTINQNIEAKSNLQGLYAMGADAWRLHARLPLLAGSENSKIQGNTGILRLDEANRVYRQQQWAMIRKGKVRILPTMAN